MNELSDLLGRGEDLTPLQMSLRAVIVFFATLILIRIGGVRIFGRRSSTDTIIIIVMGSVLARGIVGASPLVSTIAAALVMVVIHRILAWISAKNSKLETLIKSDHIILYENGAIQKKNLIRAALSEADLFESLRLETKQDSLDKVTIAYMETNGRISFILKPE